MEIKEMTMDEVVARLAELEAEVRDMTEAEDVEKATETKKALLERKAELEELEKRAAAEKALTAGVVKADKVIEKVEERKMSDIETRAKKLVETGHMTMETRQLLAAGVLTPSAVKPDIAMLPEVVSSIVDDVNAVIVDGIGSYGFAYQNTDAAAAAVTDGSNIGGTAATFDKGSISPSTWGILDSISRLVSKETPLDYMGAIQRVAYLALRRYAKSQIVAALIADASATKRMSEDKVYTLDQTFVRNLVLGFNADESVEAGTKLYLCKADLATLGAIRGTNEKKAVFDITFDDENNGTIQDGGLAVKFSILSDLAGVGYNNGNLMVYGQPKAITMPLWGNYEISTDEGGKYFDANLIGVRGLQTAGVGITSKKGIQLINRVASI